VRKAFIFTMDAILALIPLFIILATVSQLSSEGSLSLQSRILGGERIAHDVLEVMRITGDLESLNQSRLNETLASLIPGYFNYTYEVEYNGSVLFTIANGSLSKATDIMVAKRLALIEIDVILSQMLQIFHPGTGTDYCNTEKGPGEPPVYNASFYVTEEDLNTYDYWLLIERSDSTQPVVRYEFFDEPEDCDELLPENIVPPATIQEDSTWINRIKVNSYLDDDSWNYLYVRVSGNVNQYVDVYLIRVPQGTAESEITSESAKLKDFVWVTLRVWGDER
jgi:hypothetical protein